MISKKIELSNYLNLPPEKKMIIIENSENYGFSKGNNVGIDFALNNLNSEYVLLLNNDTVVDNYFLNELVDLAESDDKIIITGPTIYYYDFNGKKNVISTTGGLINLKKFPGFSFLNQFESDDDNINFENFECDWTSGAGLLLKIHKSPIKYLNNQFYFGCEDVDLCLKLKNKGYKIAIARKSKIWHKIGSSRGKKISGRFKNFTYNIKTSLKFLKSNNNLYYLYLPVYILQITKTTLNGLINKIKSL